MDPIQFGREARTGAQGRPPRSAASLASLARSERPRSNRAESRDVQDRFIPSDSISDLGLMPRRLPMAQRQQLEVIHEVAEQEILRGSNTPARLVPLAPSIPGAPAMVTIHGMNGDPASMQSVAEVGAREGREVHTLAYDDMYRRLTDNSRDLAQGLGQWMDQNPGRPLQLSAYCMGGRIALGALSELQQQGRLENREIQVDLIAPPLGGFDAADLARLDVTGVVGALIPRVRPGYDMGSGSAFQEQLEALNLPPNVRTRIFLGGRDTLIDPQSPGFQRISRNLNASVIQLPEASHGDIPAHVGRYLTQ